MINFNQTSDFFDFSAYYQGDEAALDWPEASSPASYPPTLPPGSALPESPTSTLSDSVEPSSPVLTEEEDAHYDNIIYHAVDSPVLPTSPQPFLAEVSTTLGDIPPPFAISPTITSDSIPSPVSLASSPRTSFAVSVSPPVLKRPRSLSLESSEPQAGPSSPSPPAEMPSPDPNPRPVKRARPSVPGELAFQLDVQVPAFTSSAPTGPPMGKTRQRVDYSACKCANRTGKPARHWKTACPYNPARHTNRVSCELCGMTFSRHDNMDRHMEDYH
ncbi:hypothetical protein FRC00_002161 [Tulasnella sp. 408]|nr:hypothetical protein FRC00_002161 [Tulasnella sp. 408]